MAGAVAGIELPEGDPGAVADAARGLRGVAAGFEGTAQVTQRALASVPSWQGLASVNFQSRCGDYSDAAGAAQAACQQGSVALKRFAERLEEGRERVKRIQEDAEECLRRISAAEDRATEAGDREASAGRLAFQAAFGPDAGATAAAFRGQADQAAAERMQAQDQAQRARDELDRLRERAHDERMAVEQAANAAAAAVTAAVAELPEVTWSGPFGGGSLLSPTQAQWMQIGRSQDGSAEEEDDDNALEDAGDWLWNAGGDVADFTEEQAVGFGTGVKEGVVGIGEGGAMLYRLSAINAVFNSDSYEQEWENVGQAAEYAWHNPGEFGKAVINWEDLSEGRYGEWLGNLGPDAVLAVGTAGVGTAASRGLKGADAVADTADAARDADRVADAADAAPAGRLDDLRTQAGATGIAMPEPGMKIYRTYGEVQQGYGFQRGSGPFGESWTPEPIDTMPAPRADMGLPPYNGGRYVITGTLDDPTSVSEIRRALPWDAPGGYNMPGGAPEYVIPDADQHVRILKVEGVNPDF